MFKKLTIALIASTLLAAPALAQTPMTSPRAPATAVKVDATKPVFAKAHKAKVGKVKKHKVKKLKITKHAKHSKHFAVAKPATPAHHN